MTTKKLSFAETRNEVKAQKNNSDLLNLANALETVEIAERNLARLKQEILNTAESIEAGEVFEVDTIRKLFDAVHKLNVHL